MDIDSIHIEWHFVSPFSLILIRLLIGIDHVVGASHVAIRQRFLASCRDSLDEFLCFAVVDVLIYRVAHLSMFALEGRHFHFIPGPEFEFEAFILLLLLFSCSGSTVCI